MRTDVRWAWALAALALIPDPARGEHLLKPFAAAGISHDSNVFGHSGAREARAWSNSAALSDQIHQFDLGADLDLKFGPQRLTGTLRAQRYDYARFHQLDHYEHLAQLAFDWHRGDWLQGHIEAGRERRMPELADRDGTRLALELDRHARATLDVAVTDRWHLDAAVARRRLDAPLQDLPDFALEDDLVSIGLRYRSPDALELGLVMDYMDGRFEGLDERDRPFDQVRLEATLDYAISGLSELHARLGRTRRDDRSDTIAATSEFTGALAFKRVVSAISDIDFGVFRRVESYVSGPDSVVETGASAGLDWRPTARLGVRSRLEWTRSRFGAEIGQVRRDDRFVRGLLQLDYAVLPWLSAHPFVELSARDSNYDKNRYHRYQVGLNLSIRWDRSGEHQPVSTPR